MSTLNQTVEKVTKRSTLQCDGSTFYTIKATVFCRFYLRLGLILVDVCIIQK